MITVKTFVFNPFQVNTYILFDESKECVIIDPACTENYEEKQLSDFIEARCLLPVRLFNTHAHIDHIPGNKFIIDKYKIGLEVHKKSLSFLQHAKEYAMSLSFPDFESVEPAAFIDEGDNIIFGNSQLKVLYTPGHADGSLCFYAKKDKFIITGDVLFRRGIGRTDLKTGDHYALLENIKNKLLILPDDTIVYPGHGLNTTICYEKKNNPFLS